MVQHVEECRLAEDKTRGLEHESEALVSKENESEKLIAELGLEVKHLTESASQTDIQMQELLQKFSRLESENNDLQDKVLTVLQEKAKEREALLNEIDAGTQHRDSLENQVSELRNVLEEKEQLYLSFVEKEKQLEAQRSEVQELLAALKSNLIEAKKLNDMTLKGEKIEISKHLKEPSQRSDQIIRIQQDHDQKESSLQTQHKEKLKRIQLHAETQMREKTKRSAAKRLSTEGLEDLSKDTIENHVTEP